MKKALLLASTCLLGAMFLSQPADARGTITVFNTTDTGAAIQLNFYGAICEDNRVNVAPHGKFVTNSGLCETKSFAAQLRDSKGVVHNCDVGTVAISTRVIYRIKIDFDPAKFNTNGVRLAGPTPPFCVVAPE
jgi:hypothetical protein